MSHKHKNEIPTQWRKTIVSLILKQFSDIGTQIRPPTQMPTPSKFCLEALFFILMSIFNIPRNKL